MHLVGIKELIDCKNARCGDLQNENLSRSCVIRKDLVQKEGVCVVCRVRLMFVRAKLP